EQQELTDAKKATLLMQFLEKRRKFFTTKRSKEKRNKPLTQAQKKIICTYLKNVEGNKLKDLKNKSINSIQKMIDRAFERVNTFVDFRTELVEGSSKTVGEELTQESAKKQKGKKSYYQIIKADGNSKMYMVFNQMLKEFDKEDLKDLYSLVKDKYGLTRLVEDLDSLLWDDLKTMFEPHVEDQKLNDFDDFKEEYQVWGRIVGIKSHLNVVGITAAHIDVNTALRKVKTAGKKLILHVEVKTVSTNKIIDTTKAQQVALDDALVALANHFKIGKCNHRLRFDLKSNEPTIQVATISLYHNSLRFKMNDKSHTLNVENFRDMLQIFSRLPDSKAYKEYYAVSSGAKPTKAKTKYKKKADEPVTSPNSKTASTSKGTRLKSKAKVTEPDMKKQPAKKTKAKGLAVLSEVALSEAKQMKLAIKRSKKDFHISHASGSGVPDVPPYESASDKESWGDSDDENNSDDDDQTEYEGEDVDQIDEEKLDDEESMDDEEDDEQNVSQESGFEQEEEDAHVTITVIPDAQKANETIKSFSVSSNFISKFLNLENPSSADNEIVSLMETSALHATTIPEITSGFTTTAPLPPSFFNPFLHQQTPTITTPTFTTITPTNPTMTLLEIPNFVSIFKLDQRVSALDSKMSDLKQTNQFAEAMSSILGIVDKYLAFKMKEVVYVAVQLQTNKLKEDAQAKNQEFINQVDSTMKLIIKDQVKA
nr:hypothetical protein [Tanacetum cinerariifolium]